VADKSKEIRSLSASHKLSRQTKQEKRSKCLPVPQFGGRQKQGNPENVCQPPMKSADKTREKKQMSASLTICRQTKARKSGKCLSATNKSADKTRENKKMSAGLTICWQTKSRKSRKYLPASKSAGRQNQEALKQVYR
jgi:hypothetical protein